MGQYSDEERFFVVERRLRGESYSSIATDFRAHFNRATAPCKTAMQKMVQKMTTEFTCKNLNTGRSGRPATVVTDENVLRVQESAMELPRIGTRPRSAMLDMTRTSLRRILVRELQLFPYKMQLKHAMEPQDPAARMHFADWFLRKQQDSPNADFVDNVIFFDEAHIDIDGYVNSQNARHWGSQRPTDVVERSLHPVHVTVLCGIWSKGLFRPYFFEEDGMNETINGERYLSILQNQFWPNFCEFGWNNIDDVDLAQTYFMQDGASPHIYRPVKDWLFGKFGDRVISRHFETPWPARSPDLTPCDYFMWGWAKDKVYQKMPYQNREELRTAVIEVFDTLDQETCQSACHSILGRLRLVLQREGNHIEHLM